MGVTIQQILRLVKLLSSTMLSEFNFPIELLVYLILCRNLLSVGIDTCSSVEHLIYYDIEIWLIRVVFYIN
jgi:hypothetical protein